MQIQSVTGISVGTWPIILRPALTRLLAGAALLCMFASANADQLLVTAANSNGDSVYDLNLSPSTTVPVTPVISSTTTPINTDGTKHGAFDALVWVSNSYCKSLDLIAADIANRQIVRYSGASTLPNCYTPAKGAPSVNPTAQVIFNWTKLGAGPARPNGLSVDSNGNLFVVSSSGLFDPKPSVWVLPFNGSANLYCSGAAGAYCAPVLIDGKFGGTLTLALAETLVASTSAVTSTKAVLWNAGDLLVLVGDSFDARLIVYSQTKLYSKGLLATHAMPLSAPTSTPIPWVKFLLELAAPFGMDLWPANTTLGANASVLFTTIDGRILNFNTVQNKFVTDFADRLGPGLQKLKVGTYANVPYAFVAQLGVNNTGKILEFGAPPASGPANNKPLATVSRGVMNPIGLALTNSGTQSLPTVASGTTPCAPPNAPCVFAPLGPELVSTLTAYPGDNLSGTVTEQNCTVPVDPRVTISSGGVWSCSQTALPIGAGTSYCPAFPAAVIPGSACGHAGPTGSGFAVIEGTATGIDPNDNNSFIWSAGSIDSVLPGPMNLECATFAATGQIPLIAWGSRSDLTTVEGTIPEDTLFGAPLGGAPGYLTELTAYCDTSTTGSRDLSIFVIGLGLSDTSQAYVYTLQNQKAEALEQTVSSGNISNVPPSNVQSTLTSDITTAENYVVAAQSGNFTQNVNCALNEIAAADTVVHSNLPAFSSNLVTVAPGGGNPNPAGDIDGRLANWYTVINTMLAGNAPIASWPLPPSSVPACAPASTQPQITSFTAPASSANDNVIANWTSVNTTSCTMTTLFAFNTEDTGYNPDSAAGLSTGGAGFGGYGIYYIIPDSGDEQMSNPQYATPGWGTDTYTLTCYGAAGTQPATQSLLNTTGFPPPPPPPPPPSPLSAAVPPLAITSFTTDGVGNVAWITTNATEGTLCTITDAYGGPPYGQGPVENLPPSSGTFYPYFCGAINGAVPADLLTLTCSDPNNGTDMKTLSLSNNDPEACSIE
jgi:hypothetical protein